MTFAPINSEFQSEHRWLRCQWSHIPGYHLATEYNKFWRTCIFSNTTTQKYLFFLTSKKIYLLYYEEHVVFVFIFLCLSIVSNAILNMVVQTCPWYNIFHSFGNILKSKFLGHMVPISIFKKSPYSFWILTILTRVRSSQLVVSVFISLMPDNVEHFPCVWCPVVFLLLETVKVF